MILKLTTLNLQGFKDWEKRQSKIVEYLEAVNSDIVFFQEVVYNPEVSPVNQVELLNRTLRYPYESHSVTRLYNSPNIQNHREGLSVLSRLPILKTNAVILLKDPTDKHTRIVQKVDIQEGNNRLLLANVHLSNRTDLATIQLKELLGDLESTNESRVMAGDFNLRDELPVLGELQKYIPSTRYREYESYLGRNETLDYVLVPDSMEFQSLRLSSSGLSDHLALTVTISDAMIR